MQPAALGVMVWGVLVACSCAGTGEKKQPPEPVEPWSRAHAAPAPADCVGRDKRLYGTTCCTVHASAPEERSPGEVYLDCEGPQVGQPCAREGDCDIACSCDALDQPPRPGDGPRGPADGTLGVTGVCTGTRQRGVWMCDLDERGAVTHLIVD